MADAGAGPVHAEDDMPAGVDAGVAIIHDDGDEDDDVQLAALGVPGPQAVGAKRRREPIKLTEDILKAQYANRLERFDALVSPHPVLCSSIKSKKVFGEKGQLFCLCCKKLFSIVSREGLSTGNIGKHLRGPQ